MTTSKLATEGLHRCDNCRAVCKAKKLKNIKDIFQRVAPGHRSVVGMPEMRRSLLPCIRRRASVMPARSSDRSKEKLKLLPHILGYGNERKST